MRQLEMNEVQEVNGGVRLVIAGGAVLGWAYANRGSLLRIARAAVAEHERLTAEHQEK